MYDKYVAKDGAVLGGSSDVSGSSPPGSSPLDKRNAASGYIIGGVMGKVLAAMMAFIVLQAVLF